MSCALCGTLLPVQAIVDQEHSFCCHGCHAVFNILSAKQELSGYQDHPVFKQALQAGLISNPRLLQEMQKRKGGVSEQKRQKITLVIEGMWCPSCAHLIVLFLKKEEGIGSCTVDYSTDLAVIEFCPMKISKKRIMHIIARLGYSPMPLEAPEGKGGQKMLYFRFIIAAFCSVNVMMLAYPLYSTYFTTDDLEYGRLFAWLSFLVSLPVVTFCAWPIFSRCFFALHVGIVGMETLVTIGVSSAFFFSAFELIQGGTQVYFDSMTVVIVFILLGKIIESKAKFSAKSSLLRLHKGIPNKGRKKQAEGAWAFVSTKEIKPGDVIQVLTGEKIVLDGIVRRGQGTCDESLMTGEVFPVVKEMGSPVLAGAILQHGHLEIEVTALEGETTLQKILHTIEKDLHGKATYTRAIDPLVKIFVPAVILFSLGLFIFLQPLGTREALMRMMAVLLISCPCAIGIAVPLAEAHLLHSLTNLGAIVRNRGVLQWLGRETVFAFDKTGTVTKGVFEVLTGVALLSAEKKQILNSLSQLSNHPISKAIAREIKGPIVEMEDTQEHVGMGIMGRYQQRKYYLGSRIFLEHQGFKNLASANTQNSHVFFGDDSGFLHEIFLGDHIRSEARETVSGLSGTRVLLLSGDQKNTVEHVANRCGIKEFYAEATPLNKREIIAGLKSKDDIVCMVGDGINDSPALTTADIGISVVSAAEISIQVSDILLTTDRLTILLPMRALAKKANTIIRQNLFWAFFYNLLGIPLAAMGLLSPIFAAFAMVASSLIVLFNSQRLSGKVFSALTDPSQ